MLGHAAQENVQSGGKVAGAQGAYLAGEPTCPRGVVGAVEVAELRTGEA
ncbi:MAG: hypothetical protein AVDCRST_MAG14-1518 [uncultured Rubrobacteraceae bacterium]|uniref:Uncharacterized protein n=1 Tax=uncultured Rubrobacteraceae bacterium TaxID=349277 RepID=A0A6J4R4D7_9ACTN|nr:MAG: hypothetical protein AVDCRST_MAG14-1518 [uncultured Rubrobacteraceae bacterium]